MERIDAVGCISDPISSRNHSCYSIMVIDVMNEAKSPLNFVDFWPRDVIGSLPVATRKWFEIVGVRPKSARAANHFFLCQLFTLGV